MEQTKNFLLSKTFLGIAIMLASYFLGEEGGKQAGIAVEALQSLGMVIGAGVAAYGRVKAKTQITILPQKKD